MISDHVRQLQTLRELTGGRRTTRREILDFQLRRLQELTRHAHEHVPYYRVLFQKAGLHPDQIRGIEDLQRIPITDRNDLQSLPPEQICARTYAIDKLRSIHTSGSTGMPITVRRTKAEERLLLGYRIRAAGEYGLGLRSRRVLLDYISAQTLRTEGRVQIYERFGVLPRLLFDWKTPKAQVVDAVERFRPDVLSGPPSVLSWLADDFDEEDRRRMKFRLTITGAEILTPEARQRIEHGFGAPVADLYGSHEVVFIAMQRRGSNDYRVCEDAVIFEVLNNGRPAEPGERGEVIVTGLHSFAMPFLRYRLGDRVTLGDAPADGGDPYLSIRSIDGRIRDQFVLASGRVLHAYVVGQAIEHPGIRRFQLVQEGPSHFRLHLVLFRDASGVETRVRSAVAEALGRDVDLQLEVADQLPPENGRKFHAFVPLRAEGSSSRDAQQVQR